MKIESNVYIETKNTQSGNISKIVLGRPATGVLTPKGDEIYLKFNNNFFKLLNMDFSLSKGMEEVIFYPTHYDDGRLYIKIIDFVNRSSSEIDYKDEVKFMSRLIKEMGLKNNEENLADLLKVFHGKPLSEDYQSLEKEQIEVLLKLFSELSIFQTGYKDNLPPSLIKIEEHPGKDAKHEEITKLNICYYSSYLGLINIKIEYNSIKKYINIEFNSEVKRTLDLLYGNRNKIEPLLKSMGFNVKIRYSKICSYKNLLDFVFAYSFNEKV